MKKLLTISLAALALAATVQLLLPRRAEALSQPLPALQDSQVNCTDTIAAVHTQLNPNRTIASFACENTSTDCVHLGGPGITVATGIAYGDGCAAGKIVSMDVARAWCASSAPVTLNCTYAIR